MYKKVLLFTVALLVLFSCRPKGSEVEDLHITLSADKIVASADSEDVVTFKVLTDNDVDVTKLAEIRVNGSLINAHSFSTDKPDKYVVVATYKGVKSNLLEVTFKSPEEFISSISLSTNVLKANADGVETVEFSVLSDNGIDVTNKSVIKVGDITLEGAKFATTQPGVYSAIAQFKEFTSTPIQIEFIAVPSKLELLLSKDFLVADGYDCIAFTAKDESGLDITSSTVFYVDGVKLDDHFFRTNLVGEHEVYGVFNDDRTPLLKFTSQSEFKATYKLIVESFTAVWCGYCPNGLFLLEDLSKNNQVIPLSLHPFNDPFTLQDHATLFYGYNLTGVPSMVIARNAATSFNPGGVSADEILKQYLKSDTQVGIAVASGADNDLIDARITVSSLISGDQFKLVVLVTENGLIWDQKNGVKRDLPSILWDYEHNYVVRAFSSSGVYGESITLNAHQPIEKKVSIPIDSKWKIENCDLVVLVCDANNQVINAQKVKIGEQIGY